MHGDYIGTEPENDVSAKATLTIQTIGFRGQEGIVHGQPNSVGRVQFVFEMICDHDCELSFLEVRRGDGPKKRQSAFLIDFFIH